LERAGSREARRVLLEWAIERHERDESTWSELAEETGLAIEEMMRAASGTREDQLEALDSFLASCRALAESRNHPEFLRAAEEAARSVREDIGSGRL
jgi:hypothetical protein